MPVIIQAEGRPRRASAAKIAEPSSAQCPIAHLLTSGSGCQRESWTGGYYFASAARTDFKLGGAATSVAVAAQCAVVAGSGVPGSVAMMQGPVPLWSKRKGLLDLAPAREGLCQWKRTNSPIVGDAEAPLVAAPVPYVAQPQDVSALLPQPSCGAGHSLLQPTVRRAVFRSERRPENERQGHWNPDEPTAHSDTGLPSLPHGFHLLGPTDCFASIHACSQPRRPSAGRGQGQSAARPTAEPSRATGVHGLVRSKRQPPCSTEMGDTHGCFQTLLDITR